MPDGQYRRRSRPATLLVLDVLDRLGVELVEFSSTSGVGKMRSSASAGSISVMASFVPFTG